MTTDFAPQAGEPRRLLSEARGLARRVRQAQRATWFPLLALAAVTFAAVPVDRYGRYTRTCAAAGPAGNGSVCVASSAAVFVYWSAALVVVYVATAGVYIHRGRARGIGTRARPYVIAGILIAMLVTCASLWAAGHPGLGGYDILGLPLANLYRLASAFGAMGLALLVLAWAERNRALLVFTVGFLALTLVSPAAFGWVVARSSPWSFLPHLVINGSALLLGGIGFAVAQRHARQPAT
jgi:hypothetical protein